LSPEDHPDYDSVVALIQLDRLAQRWAWCVFIVPLLGVVATSAVGASENAVFWTLLGLGLPSAAVFMKLRVPTPRFRWRDDFRGPLLVLRSFSDDRTRTGELMTGDEFGTHGPTPDNFVWQAALALWDVGRVVILKREADVVTEVYGIVIESTEEEWRADLECAARGAWAILLFPSSTPGVVEEMAFIRDRGLLWKTVVFMPPSERGWRWFSSIRHAPPDYATRWAELRDELRPHCFHLPPYRPGGLFFTPDRNYGARKVLDLEHDHYPWRRIVQLVSPDSPHAAGLLECLPEERAKES
jgi:hypothetical protein